MCCGNVLVHDLCLVEMLLVSSCMCWKITYSKGNKRMVFSLEKYIPTFQSSRKKREQPMEKQEAIAGGNMQMFILVLCIELKHFLRLQKTSNHKLTKEAVIVLHVKATLFFKVSLVCYVNTSIFLNDLVMHVMWTQPLCWRDTLKKWRNKSDHKRENLGQHISLLPFSGHLNICSLDLQTLASQISGKQSVQVSIPCTT